MPPWRIQHESHTCSEQSLRILMWNASYVQKHSIKPDRKSMKTRSEKNLEVCISTSLLDANRSLPDIKFGLKIVWKRHAGSWLSRLPLTKNWKIAGTFSQEHCSVFVGRWLQCSPAASITIPCLSRGFTSIQMFHTHTLQREGGKIKVRTMRWKWNEIERKWRWGEDENEMKVTQPGREEGNAKEEGRSKHQHRQTWPKAGKPWKGKGKEKRRPTDTEQDQRRGGRTEAPKPTYHSETYAYLSTRRTQPTCREENTWNRGPMGD